MQSEIKNTNNAYILFTGENCYFGSFRQFRQEKFGNERLYISFPENSIYVGQKAFDKLGNGSVQKDIIFSLTIPTDILNEQLKEVKTHYLMKEWIMSSEGSKTFEIKKITWTFCWSIMLNRIAKKFREESKKLHYNITNVKIMICDSYEPKVKSYIQTVLKRELKEMKLEFYNTSDAVQFGIKYNTCQDSKFVVEVKPTSKNAKKKSNNGTNTTDERKFYETRESYFILVNTDLLDTNVCYYKVSAKDSKSRIWKSGRVVNHCNVVKGPESTTLKFGSAEYQGTELEFYERKFQTELKEKFESGEVTFDTEHRFKCLFQARSFGSYDRLGFPVEYGTAVDIDREEYEQEVDSKFVKEIRGAIDKIIRHIGKEKATEVENAKKAGKQVTKDPIRIYCMPIGWIGHTSIFRYNQENEEHNGPIAEYFSKLKNETKMNIDWTIKYHNEGDHWMDMAGAYALAASFIEGNEFCKQQDFGEFKYCYHSLIAPLIELTLAHEEKWTAMTKIVGKDINILAWYIVNSGLYVRTTPTEARQGLRSAFKQLAIYHAYEEKAVYQDWLTYRRTRLEITDKMFEEITKSYEEYIEKKRREEEEEEVN